MNYELSVMNYAGLTVVSVGLEGHQEMTHHGRCEVCDLFSKLFYDTL